MNDFNNNQPFIVDYKRGDVTGDNVPDNVYLTGIKTSDSPFIQNIRLSVQDGRTGKVKTVKPKEDQGYNPTLFLGDFTGEGTDEILISINSGGSGAFMYHYIYSNYMNHIELLFDYDKFNNANEYKVTYKDNYLVEIKDLAEDTKFKIDISYKGKEYLREIYDKRGKLIEPIEGFVNPISGLYPVDFDYDGDFELLAYQKIAGRYNADSIGYILSYLKWENNRFQVYDRQIAIFGTNRSLYME